MTRSCVPASDTPVISSCSDVSRKAPGITWCSSSWGQRDGYSHTLLAGVRCEPNPTQRTGPARRDNLCPEDTYRPIPGPFGTVPVAAGGGTVARRHPIRSDAGHAVHGQLVGWAAGKMDVSQRAPAGRELFNGHDSIAGRRDAGGRRRYHRNGNGRCSDDELDLVESVVAHCQRRRRNSAAATVYSGSAMAVRCGGTLHAKTAQRLSAAKGPKAGLAAL